MLNRIAELKTKSAERAEYYKKLDFSILAKEFTALVNILNDMEDIVRERDQLKEEIAALKAEQKEEKKNEV